MKTWLAKFRISIALDDQKPVPPSVKRATAQSETLRRFADDSARLDRALKNSKPETEVPEGLHNSIMQAVRSAESAPVFGWGKIWPRLIPASALAAFVALAIFAINRSSNELNVVSQSANSSALADASSAVEISGRLMRDIPDAALSSLNDEMVRLNRDLIVAQECLVACLP